MSEINLVPENIQKIRQREVVLKKSGKFFLVSFVGSLLFFLVSFVFNYYSSNNINKVKAEVIKIEASIKEFYPAQEKSLTLVTRLEAIKTILGERIYYSKFLESFLSLVPDGVNITDLNVPNATKASISGEAQSYNSISKLLSNISQNSKVNDSIFSSVSLSQVSLRKDTGRISFAIEVYLNEKSLKNSLVF